MIETANRTVGTRSDAFLSNTVEGDMTSAILLPRPFARRMRLSQLRHPESQKLTLWPREASLTSGSCSSNSSRTIRRQSYRRRSLQSGEIVKWSE